MLKYLKERAKRCNVYRLKKVLDVSDKRAEKKRRARISDGPYDFYCSEHEDAGDRI